jgi:hypothetical protein
MPTPISRPKASDHTAFGPTALACWFLYSTIVQPWMSDALCRLSTGGGFAARTLYTDCDETAIQIQRPVILNGIDVGAVRGDLVSRVIAVPLSPIPADRRLPEKELWAQFKEAASLVFGVFLTALSQAVRDLPTVTLQSHPRMADFARLVVAAETALGFKAGEFMRAYQQNLMEGVMVSLEASPVAQALIEFMQGRQEWTGTAKQLLDAITPSSIDPGSPPPRGWPVSGRGMSAVLTRFASALRKVGIDIEHLERSGTKGRRLRLAWKVPAQPTQPSETSCGAGFRGDGSIRGDDSTDTAMGNRHQPTPENSNELNASDDSDDSDGCAGTFHTPGPPPWGTRL